MQQMRRWMAVAALLALAACSKDKDVDQPAKLLPLSATLRVDRVWTASVDDKHAVPLRLGLDLALDGNRVYAAGHRRGDVVAFDLASGRTVWRTRTKTPLSGGPAVGADLVVVGSADGEAIALSAANGAVQWRVRLNGEILSSPAVSERVVAVRTVDGKLHGLAPKDGHELWSQEQQVPRLSLRGTSSPVVVGDTALSGFDNGKVLAINMNDGSLQWEATIAPPHGRTELERLVDVDSAVRVAGQDVYAVGFQGRIAMLALDTGQIWWSHDMSSYRGLGMDDDALYVASADGEIVALRRRTGAEIWRQKALLHRGLSEVVAGDDALVVGDFQGYVHWIDKATGAVTARVRTGKVRISNAPVVSGHTVVVINDAGHITAYRVAPIMTASASGKAATTPSPTAAEKSAEPAEKSAAPPAPAAEPSPATPPQTAPEDKPQR